MKTITVSENRVSVLVLFKSRSQVVRALVIFVNWFAINFLYYGITLNLDNLEGNIYINFLLNLIVEAVGFFLSYGLLTKVGRKAIYIALLTFGAISCVAVILPVLYGSKESRWTVTALALGGKLCASACYAVLYILTAEIFPTSVRNSAIGVAGLFENAAGLASPYVADLGIIYGGPLQDALPLLVFGGASFVAALLSLLLPETRDQPMVEMDDVIAMATNKHNDAVNHVKESLEKELEREVESERL